MLITGIAGSVIAGFIVAFVLSERMRRWVRQSTDRCWQRLSAVVDRLSRTRRELTALRQRFEKLQAEFEALKARDEQLNTRLTTLQAEYDKVQHAVPLLTAMDRLASPSTEELTGELNDLLTKVKRLSDGHVSHVLFEIHRLRLAERPLEDIRARVFELRLAAMADTEPDIYQSTWRTLFWTLRELMQTRNAVVTEAACKELCRFLQRLSTKEGPVAQELFVKSQDLLIICLEDGSLAAQWDHVIPGVAGVRRDREKLRKAFNLAVSATLSNPAGLGDALIQLLKDLADSVFDVRREDLGRIARSDEFVRACEPVHNEKLSDTVFAPMTRGQLNGRVWKRVSTDNAEVTCAHAPHGACTCHPDELSFGGFWSPKCQLDPGTELGTVVLRFRDDGERSRVRLGSCRVVQPTPDKRLEGRGIAIAELQPIDKDTLHSYIVRRRADMGMV